VDSFSNIRCHQPCTGRLAHLPQDEIGCRDFIELRSILVFDHVLEVVHRLIPPNLNREGAVGLPDNATEELEIAI